LTELVVAVKHVIAVYDEFDLLEDGIDET